MILKQESSDILSGGLMEETDFSMDESSLHIVFDILRNKVYKDPISSICREVASNSRDAQREIGDFTTPIEIEISDKTDSLWVEDGLNIIFRDFGIGLSPDRVKNVYSKYGASTKRDTNTMTGGFGLGAKTPFSYADLFTVRAVYENIEYYYTIYIDKSKKGKIALINEAPFESKTNITEIIVPLKNNKDLEAFKIAVLKNTYFWPVRPILKGFNDFNYDTHNYKVATIKNEPGDYRVVYNNDVVHSSLNAIIDGIYYPIDTNILPKYKNAYEIGFLLYFNNGELTISANRESLQYDNNTISIITQKMDKILADLKVDIQNEINLQESMYQAQIHLNKLSKTSKLNSFLVHTTPISYNGKILMKQLPSLTLKGLIMHHYSVNNYNETLVRIKERDIYSGYVSQCMNNIYYAENRPFKSDSQRTNTLRADKSWVIITKTNPDLLTDKQKANHEQEVESSFELLANLGIKIKKYEDVIRTPNDKKDRAPRVKKDPEPFKNVTLREKVGYDNYVSYEFNIEKASNKIFKIDKVTPARVVYYQEMGPKSKDPKTAAFSNETMDDLMSDLQNVCNPRDSHNGIDRRIVDYIHFVRIPASKEKHVENAVHVFDFIKDPANINYFHDVYLRDKINKVEKELKTLNKFKFDKIIDDKVKNYISILNRIPYRNYYSLFSILKTHVSIKTDEPKEIIEEVEKLYPLINDLDGHDAVKKYIDLVNDYQNVKLELDNFKNSII